MTTKPLKSRCGKMYNTDEAQTCSTWDTSVLLLPSDVAMEWGTPDSGCYNKKALNKWRHFPCTDTSPSWLWKETLLSICGNWKRGLKRATRNSRRSLKKIFSKSHPFRSETLLLEADVSLLGRGGIPHKLTLGSFCVNMGKIWEDGMENPLPSWLQSCIS